MRITRESLLNLARENAAKLTAKDRGLVCVYLTGSLLRKEPFIGGVTDIDLVCVHDRPVTASREIVRINADVHLDIAHYTLEDFSPARKLRLDPWIGGAFELGSLSLEDATHWYDQTRSTAISQFWSPANVSGRSKSFLTSARQNWQALSEGTLPQGIKRTQAFLNAIREIANATAVISGMPLTVRRLFLELPERTETAGIPDLTGTLVELFTSDSVTDDQWTPWLEELAKAFEALKLAKDVPPSVHPNRRSYFEKAIYAMAEERPAAALWVLLDVWTMAAAHLPKSDETYKTWQTFCQQLNLDGKHLPARIEGLDAALDQVEEAIDSL